MSQEPWAWRGAAWSHSHKMVDNRNGQFAKILDAKLLESEPFWESEISIRHPICKATSSGTRPSYAGGPRTGEPVVGRLPIATAK